MRSFTSRQMVFVAMVLTVLVGVIAYAGSSTPWAGSAFALAPSGSTPAPPINLRASNVTPTSMTLSWDPDLSNGAPDPWGYLPTIDTTVTAHSSSLETSHTFSGLVPGSLHTYYVTAHQGMLGDPSAPFPFTQPKAPVVLDKVSVPSAGKTSKAIKVSGKLSSTYALKSSMTVRLKFYRWEKKSGKKQWVLKKTVTAKRPSATSYYYSLKFKPAGTWSVIAESGSDGQHSASKSARSKSIKIK
jgi:hypothetical protein